MNVARIIGVLGLVITGASGAGVSVASDAPTGSRLSIPTLTWIRRTLPETPDVAPVGAMKHLRIAVNRFDGKLYVTGGDHSGGTQPPSDSGRQETFTYDVAADRWEKVYPYCGPPGDVQPARPDQVGWTFDARRRLFWLVPGDMAFGHIDPCPPGGSTKVQNRIMTFDPVSKKWTNPGRKGLPSIGVDAGVHLQAVHDDVTDTIYVPSQDGMLAYNVDRDRWRRHEFGRKFADRTIRLNGFYAVRGGRHIYSLDNYARRLYRFGIDGRALEDLGRVPGGPGLADDEAQALIAWDSASERLVYFRAPRLQVFDLASREWTEVHPRNEGEFKPFGNCLVYDDVNNALVTFGGLSARGNPHLYVIRLTDRPGERP